MAAGRGSLGINKLKRCSLVIREEQLPGTLVGVIEKVKVAVVGVGNNTSALVQGISFYRNTGSLAADAFG